ncbi:hypothetical protein [Streptomyces sp. XD-27]|uniref:hypothetical protein n=1 Tax=Streptomyces sp. XD-27 TaxID=3062779 RepID=UPI0026F45643|nr:hypothetical protein [Streptomyces sp. XD-27]WKX70429.1 hypothetical protein Q3Y56_11285 [Streptomyces sp. XD-27]
MRPLALAGHQLVLARHHRLMAAFGRRGRAVPTALLAVALTALPTACVGQGSSAGASPSTAVGPGGTVPAATASPSGRIDTGLAYFHSAAGAAPEVREVIRTRGQLTGFAERFGRRAPDITAGASGTDFSRVVLVGWSLTTGCAHWTSATLRRSGDTLELRPGPHATPPPECFAPYGAVAVLTVPRERMPKHPRFTH